MGDGDTKRYTIGIEKQKWRAMMEVDDRWEGIRDMMHGLERMMMINPSSQNCWNLWRQEDEKMCHGIKIKVE